MKLTIISIFCPPEKGAAPFRIFNMAKELKNRGVDVEIITALANYPTGKIFKEYKGRLYKKEKLEGITCKRFWLFPSNSNNPIVRVFGMLSFAFAIFFALPSLIKRKPDVVYVQTPPLLVGYAGVILGKLIWAKVVLNVSDIWPMTAAELGVIKADSRVYRFFEFVERRIYKKADAFVGQSNQILAHLKKFVGSKPTFLYRNLSYNVPQERKLEGREKIKIVYAGLLGFAQGVAEICKTIDFEGLGLEFHIYGSGVQREEIEALAQGSPAKAIVLHDPIPKDDLQRLLYSFDATIIPLQKEIYGATPSKIYMAIAAELPIIFAGGGEGAQIVEKYKLGFVSGAGDHVGLKESLINFAALNEAERKKLHENLANARSEHFAFKKQQDRLFDFINSELF